jgi:ATP-dependent DNA helicase DinG
LSLRAIFSQEGPLAAAIPGFRTRDQQIEMAERIAAAIEDSGILIAEAGTGTGKTFAYLVPALQTGGKVILSTGTKTLQDQLFNKDLPVVQKALKIPAQTALLKGRANYLCHYQLRRAASEGRFRNREEVSHLAKIQRFSKQTKTGDKARCSDVPESSPVWAMVTSSRENCLGQACPDHNDCFVLAARKAAMEADLVVVNHHLFFADVMLRDEGLAELLPACNTVIFDEAHQLPEIASLFFGESLSTAQFLDWARDTRAEGLEAARDCVALQTAIPALEKAARDLRLSVGVETGRFAARQMESLPEFLPAFATLLNQCQAVEAILKTQAERSEGLKKCWQRLQELEASLNAWRNESGNKTPDDLSDESNTPTEKVRWGEAFNQSLQLSITPLSVADIFSRQLETGHPRAWIFTSATLAVQGRFEHYQAELGLEKAATGYWESPFDYGQQAILYAPRGLPEPNSPHYTEATLNAAWPLIKAAYATQGGVFFLCTSLKAMRRIHEGLQEKIEQEALAIPLFLQGESGKNELLERFRQVGNGVLVGSQSFWEGVDVKGEALSLVIMDKIPFAPPDDPVLAARIEAMRRTGKNAFLEYQLPRAIINVKQGAGRLIRTETDRGALMICDPRMLGKSYGYRVWRSLPPMRRTRELDEALAFLYPTDRLNG